MKELKHFRSLLVLGLALQASPALAQGVKVELESEAPTRFLSVPKATVLDSGSRLLSVTLFGGGGTIALPTPLGGIPGLASNAAASARYQMGLGGISELDLGVTGWGPTPTSGALDANYKLRLLEAPVAVAVLAGAMLQQDSAGSQLLWTRLGLPITTGLEIADHDITLGLHPAYYYQPLGAVPASSFGLGAGLQVETWDDLYLLADSDVLSPGTTVVGSRLNLGVRYEFSDSLSMDGFLGFQPGTSMAGNSPYIPGYAGVAAHLAF